MQASGDGAPIRATVKWFNAVKGFGFVTPVDGSPEAFLHLSALKQAGYDGVGEGAGVLVEIGQSPKGRQVLRVLEVDASSARPMVRPMRGPTPQMPMVAPEDTEVVNGTVKWFSPIKGYGFISPEGGGKDVFLHVTVLRNAGIPTLEPGQTVRMRVTNARKGPEAVTIELLAGGSMEEEE